MGDAEEVEEFATKVFGLARSGETELLRAYVEAGVPVDLTNQAGDTLLMLAAYHGHAGTARMLVEHGADAGRENDRGQSPLAGAVFKKEAEVVRVLLEAGASPDAGTPTAREAARMFGNSEFLEWFEGR
ncbi:hypothetical protein EDD29_5824 [Actinocorallia herbida]|uniref:Uncharacterized protein n=1 Tax=Actinocorallia herbida TaxID=58109 RepID=A0A3N1D3R0_9ACTN|nr:ankyrin repeat domain-containing protein [Actinocorallia herbida]ROO88162.1 hypothetical protein EDD29_5824 [Actinocorallia herbida]